MKYFVTGGSRGIGAAIVLRAARDGHDVAFTYVKDEAAAQRVVAEATAHNPRIRCSAFQLDSRSSAAVENVVDDVLEKFTSIDVVVPNAGINRNALCLSMSDDEWRDVIDTNLTGAFFVCRQVLPTFLANRRGRFVFVSSLGRSGVTGQVNYAASKAGLLGLSASLAKEYGRKGITSNVVAPGFIDTDMTREHMGGIQSEHWLKYCPLGRLGRADEIASVVAFLASDDASYVNGACIPVTAGLDWAP